jgi:hypothetical protein
MIIGFSGKLGSGKSYAAAYTQKVLLQKYKRVSIIPFAGAVKRIAKDSFFWDGIKDAKGRRLLQVIGTEAGREYDTDMWIKHMMAAIAKNSFPDVVIIDDVRFPNEFDYIRNSNGKIIRVTAGDIEKHPLNIDLGHLSETALDSYETEKKFDALLYNRFDDTFEPLVEMTLQQLGIR